MGKFFLQVSGKLRRVPVHSQSTCIWPGYYLVHVTWVLPTKFKCVTSVKLIEAICFLLSPSSRKVATFVQKSLMQPQASQLYMSHALCRKKITGGTNGGLINEATLKSLDVRRDFLFPLSLLFHNTRPVGQQVLKICTTCKLIIIYIFVDGLDALCFRTPCSCCSLSFFWQTFLLPSSYYFSHFGFLLRHFLLFCLFYLYHCFSRSLLA